MSNAEGDWTCLCGNTPTIHGFCPVNDQNEEVEPTADDWTTGHYACFFCGRVIDQGTLRVVRHVHPNSIWPLGAEEEV